VSLGNYEPAALAIELVAIEPSAPDAPVARSELEIAVADLVARGEAQFLLYQAEDGRTRIEVRFDGETAWVSILQMAELFQRDRSVILRHIGNVFDEGELDRTATCARSAQFNARANTDS
jgi:hypothetical protein